MRTHSYDFDDEEPDGYEFFELNKTTNYWISNERNGNISSINQSKIPSHRKDERQLSLDESINQSPKQPIQ